MLDDYDRRLTSEHAWTLEEEGRPAGVLFLEVKDGGLPLDNRAVFLASQGRGYGQGVIAATKHEARRREYGEIRLCTNALMTENLTLYSQLGCRETGHVTEKGSSACTTWPRRCTELTGRSQMPRAIAAPA